MGTPATIVVDADGTYLEATAEALELLGVTMDDLRRSRPGRFAAEPPDPDGDAAFRGEWESSGRPDLGGRGTIRRADGRRVRVRFAVSRLDDGRFVAVLEPIGEPVDEAARVYTLGEILSAWRAAERRLETVPPATPEWDEIQAEMATFREQYQQLFEIKRRAAR